MIRIHAVVAVLAVLGAAPSISAALFVQTVPLSFSQSGTTTTAVLVGPGAMSGTFDPFDADLGTLNSYRVEWSVNYQLEVVHQTSSSSSISTGGTYYLGAGGYGGNGGGNSTGAGIGSLSAGFSVSHDQLFLPSNAGVSYDPQILASVTGTSPFTALWQATATPSLGDVSSWAATAVGSVRVTYDYTPVPEPAESGIVAAFIAAGVVFGLRRWRVG